jgi:RNA polymerase primary sigma factor
MTSEGLNRLRKTVYESLDNIDSLLLSEVLNSLTPREHDILFLHLGLGDDKKYDLSTVATMLGLAKERTSQSYLSAIRKMRHPSRVKEIIKKEETNQPKTF